MIPFLDTEATEGRLEVHRAIFVHFLNRKEMVFPLVTVMVCPFFDTVFAKDNAVFCGRSMERTSAPANKRNDLFFFINNVLSFVIKICFIRMSDGMIPVLYDARVKSR